jgi:hypothetical protein
MNPNIKRLIEDSGFYASNENKAVSEEELEALVESVIRKCMKVAYNNTPETEDLEYGWLIHGEIAKHFGIKE